GKLPAPQFAKRIAFPTGIGRARPAWEVHTTEKLDVAYRTVVDAATGEILYRHSRVQNEAPEGRVFLNHPGAPKGGTHDMASFAGDPTASPEGWLGPAAALPLTTTTGNNAVTATAWVAGILAPDGPGEVRAVGVNGVFDYAFNDAWAKSNCGGPTGLEPSWAQDALPASVSLFYHHNIAHDFWYRLGFDETAGALQLSNFGKTGPDLENDPLLGLVQSSPLAASNNAYMSTDADGLPSWSGMFLFSNPFPCADGDFDSEVIYHEYAHAVSNRWVGAEFGNLDTHQGGSMGEAWGDFAGVHYLHSIGVETRDALGPYVTGDEERGIRNWGLSKVEAGFGDIGYDNGAEVHSDGEIWSGVLWDLRTTLAKASKDGADLTMQLVADAMPLSGPSPSMLDMRDAILAADKARTKGANQALLWTVFARHGMGFSAVTDGGDDTDPVPGFDVKDPGRNGTLTGRVVDSFSGKPVPDASIVIGTFEVGITPLARTAADGTFRLRLAEGRHVITIGQRGYGSQKIPVTIRAGEPRSGDFLISPNFASWSAGARPIVGDDAAIQAARKALDDSEGSRWIPSSARKELIVKLGGESPVDIAKVNISSLGGGGSALKDWELLVSGDGKTFRPATRGAFGKGRLGAAVNDLTYHAWKLPQATSARYVKLVAKSLQSQAASSLAVAELQVFGRGTGFEAKVVKLKAFHNEGLAIVPVPAGFVFASPTSITEYLMGFVCTYPPPTQGLDAFVTELPEEFASGSVPFTATAEPLAPDPQLDADVTFLDQDCARLGSSESPSANESGVIPSGTRYVVHHLFLNTVPARLSFDIAAGTTVVVSPAPAVKVGGTKQTKPRVKPGLPATGVAGHATTALYAFAA
ncbi:MAG: M36 family metallopeptidase, partial [Actinomycetota bacterium]